MPGYNGLRAWDVGNSGPGFSSTTAYGSGNACPFTRNTADGLLQFTQVISK